MAEHRLQEAFVDGAGWHELPPGRPVPLSWGVCKAFDGYAGILWSAHGVAALFPGHSSPESAAAAIGAELQYRWRGASANRDDSGAAQWLAGIDTGFFPPLHLKGTAFQLQVWRGLMAIPPGETLSYSALAESIDRAGAVRAVASAVARNPLSIVVPCHRVVPLHGRDGGQYRWGSELKQRLLQKEASVLQNPGA